MIKTEIVDPNITNFIESIRELGYSFEVAVSDLIDNSITARASVIKIETLIKPNLIFSLLDNGYGMTEAELIEAMRLATKNPKDKRDRQDLGRFGLGLKTASFSQCKKLTLLSKKDGILSARQWDLDYICEKNKWLLITPNDLTDLPLVDELNALESGSLIIWQSMDRGQEVNYSSHIDRLRKHLSLVFHRFLEGADNLKALKIVINNNPVIPFNPFNLSHPATQQIALEKIKSFSENIEVQPFILPHHSKLSQQEYDLYATEDGYIKSQGFYLYRENRILIYGTWWGLHKSMDAHKLVRIKIDITNGMDKYWGIDIKKSSARPPEHIRDDLKRIITKITEIGSRPYSGRGGKIKDKSLTRFWDILAINEDLRFSINKDHPLYRSLVTDLDSETINKLKLYLNGIQAFLPLDAIQSNLQKNPHQIKQESAFSEADILELTNKLNTSGLDPEYIKEFLNTEIYKNRREILNNEF